MFADRKLVKAVQLEFECQGCSSRLTAKSGRGSRGSIVDRNRGDRLDLALAAGLVGGSVQLELKDGPATESGNVGEGVKRGLAPGRPAVEGAIAGITLTSWARQAIRTRSA